MRCFSIRTNSLVTRQKPSTVRRGDKRPTGAARGYTLDFAYISVYMQLMPLFECAVFGVSKATGRLPRRPFESLHRDSRLRPCVQNVACVLRFLTSILSSEIATDADYWSFRYSVYAHRPPILVFLPKRKDRLQQIANRIWILVIEYRIFRNKEIVSPIYQKQCPLLTLYG